MAASFIERTRMLHEDIEQAEEKAAKALAADHKTLKETVLADHKVKYYSQQYRSSAKRLLEIYDDDSGERDRELNSMKGSNVYSIFVDRVKAIRNYHRQYPHLVQTEQEAGASYTPEVEFMAEEHYGKYLDLQEFHERYINLPAFKPKAKGETPVDYVTFLDRFYKLWEVPKRKKLGANAKAYREFVEDMLTYMLSFHARVFPLVSQQQMLAMIEQEFHARWEAGDVPGWLYDGHYDPSGQSQPQQPQAQAQADGGATAMDTDSKQPQDAVKQEDPDDPLYCRVCCRGFAKQTTFDNHLKGKKHKKNQARAEEALTAAGGPADGQQNLAQRRRTLLQRALALTEFRIKYIAKVLEKHITATRQHAELKQTLTLKELEAERAEEEEEILLDDESESEEEGAIYNPHKVPLGWDGKPIPYWLFKLHGLNLEFKCEICGDYSYRGPRAFQRHFLEARHTANLKALGITNTKHFHGVTLIEDAITLHQKVKHMSTSLEWNPMDLEEFEDADGNVFNKKTYLDLKRQGLV